MIWCCAIELRKIAGPAVDSMLVVITKERQLLLLGLKLTYLEATQMFHGEVSQSGHAIMLLDPSHKISNNILIRSL